jgi:2-keto-3-deoxy-L-fuconate dehydrogenase
VSQQEWEAAHQQLLDLMAAATTPFRLDGRKALVTGGASGIGEAVCRVLSAAGAAVTIVDMDRGRAEALARQIPQSSVLILDISDEPAVNAALRSLSGLDILVNNAGIGMVGSIEETEAGDFARLYRVNVEGTYLVSRAALPLLLESQGSIVNIGSVAGLVGLKRRFAYCTTKGAVVAMSRQMAVEYAGRIRVNCVCPGTVDTPFVEGYLEKYHRHEKEKVREELKLRQPIGRLGRPEEIAHMVQYLCSEEAGFVTGSVVTIDGGWTAA